jgi:hypothetical protein
MSTPRSIITGVGVSLVLRLPSTSGSIEQVAEAHNKVITEHGSAWLGIVGKTYSAENIRNIRQNGDFLYVVQKRDEGTSLYKGKIADISKSVPRDQCSLVPTYYQDLGISERANLWVKLSTLRRSPTREIDTLWVVSFGKNASALLSGRAYLGIVEKR